MCGYWAEAGADCYSATKSAARSSAEAPNPVSILLERSCGGCGADAGAAATLFHAFCAGCDGGVLALAALVPEKCVALQALVRDNRIAEARQLQRELLPLARLIGGPNGVPALKAALDLIGYEGGPPRPPLEPVSAGVMQALRPALEQHLATSPIRR